MPEDIIDGTDIIPVLNDIMLAELAGVIRYTHYSLVITGPNRLPLVAFMQEQADESLLHARQAGEILTGLGGHPEQGIGDIEESHDHAIENILRESVEHERRALDLYRQLLALSEGNSVYLEEYARTQIGEEELHVIELTKLLRDYTIG
ncbi:MAG: bacterioferritin [Ilumatobacter sp.]